MSLSQKLPIAAESIENTRQWGIVETQSDTETETLVVKKFCDIDGNDDTTHEALTICCSEQSYGKPRMRTIIAAPVDTKFTASEEDPVMSER